MDPRAVADAVAAPATAVVTSADFDAVRRRLVADLSAMAGPAPGGRPVVVATASLGAGLAGTRPPAVEPFAWGPRLARRSLGLAAIRACLAGRFPAPAAAVGPVAEDAVSEWRHTGWRTFHWEPWLAGLAPGARAAVVAEASTWATNVWLSVRWDRLGAAVEVGGPADRWACPGTRPAMPEARGDLPVAVTLTARPDLRVPIHLAGGSGVTGGGRPAPASLGHTPARGAVTTTLVAVWSGLPAGDYKERLAYLALVAGLRGPGPVPARVAGLWPDADQCYTVEVARPILERAAECAVSAAERLLGTQPAAPPPR